MSNQTEERMTMKMTPDQLLGLQHHARQKSVTLTPEISIIDADLDAVVAAIGTQESVPITVAEAVVEPRPTGPLRRPIAPTDHRAAIAGAIALAVAAILALRFVVTA